MSLDLRWARAAVPWGPPQATAWGLLCIRKCRLWKGEVSTSLERVISSMQKKKKKEHGKEKLN